MASYSRVKVWTSEVLDSADLNAEFNAVQSAVNNIATAQIVDAAVTEAKIGALAVSAAKLAASAVTTAKINDLAVTEAKIADDAVTPDKADIFTKTWVPVTGSGVEPHGLGRTPTVVLFQKNDGVSGYNTDECYWTADGTNITWAVANYAGKTHLLVAW